MTKLGFFVLLATLSCSTTPTKPATKLAIANEYAKDGLLREAADAYRAILKKSPNHRTARRNLGIVQIKAGAYDDAVLQLEAVIGHFEGNYEANFYLAEGYRITSKYAEAIYRYQKALRIKPKSTKTMKALAWSYYKIRYYREALDLGKKMRKLAPDDGQISIIVARTLLKLRKPKSAMKILMRSKRSAPEPTIPFFESVEGDILRATNRCSKAIGVYRSALRVEPLLAGSLLGLGACHLKIGKFTKSIDYLERALRVKPQLTEALLLLGKAYEPTNSKKALFYYNRFRKQAAADPEFLPQLPRVGKKISALTKQLKG